MPWKLFATPLKPLIHGTSWLTEEQIKDALGPDLSDSGWEPSEKREAQQLLVAYKLTALIEHALHI
jgi:hypothetical protein